MIYIVAEPLDLIGIDIRCAHLHRGRQIDNHLVIRRRLDDIDYCVTYVDRKIHLGAREAFGTVFEDPLSFGVLCCCRLDQLSAINSNFGNTRSVESKYVITLNR